MQTIDEVRLDVIAKFLIKYTDPVPALTGMTARGIGRLLLDQLGEAENIYAETLHEAYPSETHTAELINE